MLRFYRVYFGAEDKMVSVNYASCYQKGTLKNIQTAQKQARKQYGDLADVITYDNYPLGLFIIKDR